MLNILTLTLEKKLDNFEGNDAERRSHYNFYYKGTEVDPYLLLFLYKISDPGLHHAIKKIIRAGKSKKSYIQDIEESIVSIKRSVQIIEEVESPLITYNRNWLCDIYLLKYIATETFKEFFMDRIINLYHNTVDIKVRLPNYELLDLNSLFKTYELGSGKKGFTGIMSTTKSEEPYYNEPFYNHNPDARSIKLLLSTGNRFMSNHHRKKIYNKVIILLENHLKDD